MSIHELHAETRISRELLPVLVAWFDDGHALADVLRAALFTRVTFLPLDEAPVDDVLHALELHASNGETLVVAARPIGDAVDGLYPLQLRPLDERETTRIRRFLARWERRSDPLVGTVLGGRYRIEALIGHGAMGSVYRAHHITLDKPIAVKVLNAALRDEPTFAARFLGEARAASRLDHPGILRVLDFGDESDLLYMVMELLEGRTLEEEAALGPMEVTRALDLVARIGDALGVAHDKGVVHRDIKPENVVLTADRVVVCDFGVAQVRGNRVTVAGAVCGTPDYMAPEQGRGEEVGPAADVYAAGVLLYRLLTGRLPFTRATSIATVLAHITEPVPRPTEVRPELPTQVEDALLRILAKDPRERPADGAALAALLRACVAEEHSQSAERPRARAALLEALDAGDVVSRIQAIAALRRASAIEGEVVTKLIELVDPLSGEPGELRVAAAVALGDARPSAYAAALDALSAAMIPRSGGVVGLMHGDRNDDLVIETAARVLIELGGDEGRRIVASRASRAKTSLRPRLQLLLDEAPLSKSRQQTA